jgi:hypothetical protein
VAAVPLRNLLRPLVIAPAGACAVIGCFLIVEKNVGPYLPIVLLILAPFVYAAELVFVIPILLLWPASRRPSYTVGAAWGAAAAWGFAILLQAGAWYDPGGVAFPPRFRIVPSTWREWQGLTGLMMPGAAFGVLFAYFSRKNSGF